uniref:Secreted protein n=1 Tax=Sinocyclocheilus anshuiensis TaxID=1608454 RepID=A0A671S4G1_9TELE
MHRCVGGVCVSLIVCAFLTETLGMAIAVRGLTAWCSAGCSNDHVIMCGFAFDKHGLAGKREMPISRQVRNMHQIGALDSLPSSLTSEEISQA